MDYEVKLYPRAYRDIEEIYTYISEEKLSPEIAEKLTCRIWNRLRSLQVFPYAHQERLVGRYAGKGYRQLMIDNYIAIYRIDEKQKTVFVITIQYQGKNI